MDLDDLVLDKLRTAVVVRYDERRANKVMHLVQSLTDFEVNGVATYIVKLDRALRAAARDQGREFAGILREGDYVRRLARSGGICSMEPLGKKGPDVAVAVEGERANIEIKRLRDAAAEGIADDADAWLADELDEDYVPMGDDKQTEKLLGVAQKAVRQLVRAEPNVLVLAKRSTTGTLGNFRRATRFLQEEISSNGGAYGRISAIQYMNNSIHWANNVSISDRLWINPGADTSLPKKIELLLRRTVLERAMDW